MLLSARVSGAEFKDSASVFSVVLPSGWKEAKSERKNVALRLENGAAFFEFTKLDAELGDYSLLARVKERADALRSEESNTVGSIESALLCDGAVAYYILYKSTAGPREFSAAFSCNGASYSLTATGFGEKKFQEIFSTIGKAAIPGPEEAKAAQSSGAVEAASRVQIFKEDEPGQPPLPAVRSKVEERLFREARQDIMPKFGVPKAPAVTTEGFPWWKAIPVSIGPLTSKAGALLSDPDAGTEQGSSPYVKREPVNILIWAGMVLVWLAGACFARVKAAAYENPRLPPPPAEVPPDFFFPFLISSASSSKGVTYNVVTRQNQLLLADFLFKQELYFVAAVYGALLFHLVWSLLALFGLAGLVTNGLLILPGGRFLASFPEIFFLGSLLIWFINRLTEKPALRLFDAQSNLLLEVKKESGYGLLRDSGGKEIATLSAKTGANGRRWEYVDSDNMVVFSIKDDCPQIHLLRRIFGNLGGLLRVRYGIFVQERRAGFVFLNPHYSDKFQIHMDFSFARLARPVDILACVLYIVSRERDPAYPSPF